MVVHFLFKSFIKFLFESTFPHVIISHGIIYTQDIDFERINFFSYLMNTLFLEHFNS